MERILGLQKLSNVGRVAGGPRGVTTSLLLMPLQRSACLGKERPAPNSEQGSSTDGLRNSLPDGASPGRLSYRVSGSPVASNPRPYFAAPSEAPLAPFGD